MVTVRKADPQLSEHAVVIEDPDAPGIYWTHAAVAVEMRQLPALIAQLQQILETQSKEQIDVDGKNDGDGPPRR